MTNRFKTLIKNFIESSWRVKLSAVLMGGAQISYGCIGKGLLFFLTEVAAVAYFVNRGISDIEGFFTLGTTKADAWTGTLGDNSVVMLLMGIFAWIVLGIFVAIYVTNLKDALAVEADVKSGKKPKSFLTELKELLDKKFYITVLVLPVIGVCIFNVLPIIFMILISFTNYGGSIVPPELVDWVGIDNFKKILTLSKFAPTFIRILGWNVLWAILSTTLNYFAGLGLALLLNKDCVKGKAFWRAFPVLAYAIPGFITLLAFKFMFSYGGPINEIIRMNGGTAIGFLDLDAKWSARIIGLIVNCWISVPSIMLLATGHLSNRDMSLYEAARIDGATPLQQFKKLTLPFMLFATTPVLLGQFIGNFNNFGIFYFLRGGLYLDGYFLASDTDLLINWLYNLSIDNNYYCIGAAISLIIFAITSVISLVVYVNSPSFKEEDTFQ
ncbi:arabinogalactan oligomer / maltooligosaccharide transport system permease protein [Pseudobutyrivibrio sp. YE44]|nr:arabinogalactan oligomer / maltooligosaccharide transport system permease protein [Pseudobutyrivibrio sp. YE44]